MTTTLTLAAIRADLYNQIPGLGFTGLADTFPSTTTMTDAFSFADSILQPNSYRGNYLYRPTTSGDDRVKRITVLNTTSGTVTVSGTPWIDTATNAYEVIGPMHPDELNACVQRALRRIYYEVLVPLCGELTDFDGDMQLSSTTNWTDVGTVAKSKVATTTNVAFGVNTLRTLNSATNSGVQSATMRGFGTNGGDWMYVSTVVRADAGTASLQLYNVTASSVITSVTSAEEGFVHLWLMYQLPSGCEELAVRLVGLESNADLYWNHLVVYRRDTLLLAAPSYVDEQFKLLKLREARYNRQLLNQSTGGYDDAYSRYFQDWLQPSMYTLDPFHTDTHPYRVQLMRPLPQAELWVECKRPWSEYNIMNDESDTTLAPSQQLYAYCKQEVGMVLRKRYPGDERWKALAEEAKSEVDSETTSRPEVPAQPLRREWLGRI